MCHHILGKMTTFDIEVASKERQGTELPKFRLLALKVLPVPSLPKGRHGLSGPVGIAWHICPQGNNLLDS